jgi:organic radical activating enzyme
MSVEVFEQALSYAERACRVTGVILISGGEPFEHPQIKEILEKTVKTKKRMFITVATNGTKLIDDKSLYSWYKEFVSRNSNVYTQVTNVPRFYPRELTLNERYWLSKLKNCCIVTEESQVPLYPQGRALENYQADEYRTHGPKCMDAVLIALQTKVRTDFELIEEMVMRIHKFCVPRINIDGSIAIGESRLCPTIGTLSDTPEKRLENIRRWNCRGCKEAFGIMANRSPEILAVLRARDVLLRETIHRKG